MVSLIVVLLRRNLGGWSAGQAERLPVGTGAFEVACGALVGGGDLGAAVTEADTLGGTGTVTPHSSSRHLSNSMFLETKSCTRFR
jgi:hypothetical protein